MSSKWYHNNTAKTDILAHSSRDFAYVIIAVGEPPGVRRARPACVSGDWPPRSTRSQGSRARLPPSTPPPPPPHAPRREKRELVCACAIRRATRECGGDRITPAYLPAVVGPPLCLGRNYTAVLLSVVYTYNIITIILWSLVTVRLLSSISVVI